MRGAVVSAGSAAGSAIWGVAWSCGAAMDRAIGAKAVGGAPAAGAAVLTVPEPLVTARVALPPSELVTRTVPGLARPRKIARYWPPPLFCSVPMRAPVASLNAVRVAVALLLVASTRSARMLAVYSARVTVTRSLAGAAAGVTVRRPVTSDEPLADAVTSTGVEAATVCVVAVKVALVWPEGTLTLAGTVTAAFGLDSETDLPREGGAELSRTVPVDEVPPVTLAGEKLRLESVGAGAAPGGLTVSVAVLLCPAKVAVIVTVWGVVTWLTVIVKL